MTRYKCGLAVRVVDDLYIYELPLRFVSDLGSLEESWMIKGRCGFPIRAVDRSAGCLKMASSSMLLARL